MARTVGVSGADAKSAESTGFKAYPEGEYIGEIIDVKSAAFAKSGQHADKTKYPANNIQVKFTEAGPGEEFVGKKFTAWQVPDFPKFASGKSAWLFYQFYKATGVEFPEGDGDVELPDLDDLYGEEIGIRISREEQQDAAGNTLLGDDGEPKYRNRVSAFFPASKGVKVTGGGEAAGAGGGFTL